jgi:Flp pilus assembly protein TadG
MIPFFAMVLGLIEYGWYFYVAQNTSGATSTLARKLEVGDCWASPLTFAQKQSKQVTAVTLSPSSSTAPAVGSTFTVTLTADAKIMTFIPVPNGGVVTRKVTAQIEDDKPSTC